ncbi:MAG: hypothetical protein COA79_02665 [Planctomycetota bacterium]|nr:MAG: hypothetical protein COA79_02665 [Planctomycetota bacterium]
MAKKKKKSEVFNDEDLPVIEVSSINDQSNLAPEIQKNELSKDFKYFDVANPVALFPFISFMGDDRPIREWTRSTINPNDGAIVEQKIRFIADAGTNRTAQGKAAWLALLGIKYLWERRNKPIDGKVSFSMHELCRIFDIPYNGRRAKEFNTAFTALTRMTIESSNALTLIDPKSGKRNPITKETNSTFISFYGKLKTGEKGREVERYFVQINAIYIQCLNTQDSSRVNLAMIANLNSSRSISLYILLCSIYQTLRSEVIDYNLEDLSHDLPLNPKRKALSKIKEDLEPILKELIRNDLLKSYVYLSANPQKPISKRPKASEVIIRFELGQRVVIEPAQVPYLVDSSSLMLATSQEEDAIVSSLTVIGFSVNEANYIYKAHSKDHLEYAINEFERIKKSKRISSPTKYFNGILEKANPDDYQKVANAKRKKKISQSSSKNINELYKKYYSTSKENVLNAEGLYWDDQVKEEIDRLSHDDEFMKKTKRDKKSFVEYDLLTSAPYNVLPFNVFKDLYMTGDLAKPYMPQKN